MNIIDYATMETEKSMPVIDVDDICIPEKIEDYIVNKDNIVYRNDTTILCSCNFIKNDMKYILKVLCEYDEEIIELIYRNSASSEYIVPIIARGYIAGGGWYQIFPNYEDGSIANTIMDMTVEDLMRMVHDINEALHFMHTQIGIVHMDVKPENIFSNNGKYLLGDYDVSKKIGHFIKKDKFIGTRAYAPVKDFENENTYVDSWDYATFGNVIAKLMEVNDRLNVPIVRNIIGGLTNVIEARWGYEELRDICSGKYIDCGQNIKSKKLTVDNRKISFLFGFDDNDSPIYATTTEELGRYFRQYREIALIRHIKNRNAWEPMLAFIDRLDQEKSKKIRKVLNEECKEYIEILDKISQILLPNEAHLFYKGKMYADFESLLRIVSQKEFEVEFIHFIKSKAFKDYLDELGNETYKKAFEKIGSVKNISEETLYYLTIYFLQSGNSFERKIINNSYEYDEIDVTEQIRNTLCINIDLFKTNIAKLEAWLIIHGYADEICKILEVSSKYE